MITGLERLNSSATCWASLKLRGVTTCIEATPPPFPAAAPRLGLLGGVIDRATSPASRGGLVVAEDVVNVLLATTAATRGRAARGLARRDARVERHLAAGVALVVLALLDVVTLNEAEVLECASPCVPDSHFGS